MYGISLFYSSHVFGLSAPKNSLLHIVSLLSSEIEMAAYNIGFVGALSRTAADDKGRPCYNSTNLAKHPAKRSLLFQNYMPFFTNMVN
jgi:hypothetical protein